MAESSRFWNTIEVGDGGTGYGRDLIAGWMRSVFARGEAGGVLRRVLNELAVSGTSSPLSVASGAAIVDGIFYENTTAKSMTVTTPSVGTTGGRVVLRADWSAQTVRAAVLMSADGTAALPALTQVSGTTYEIGLASFTITTGGAITLTDARGYITFSTYLSTAMIRMAALSVLGRASNSTGQSEEITGSDGQALRRSGTALGFGQLAAAAIAANAVTNAKLRDSAGLSVIGRAANSTGNVTDIAAGTDLRVLGRSGSNLAWLQIIEAMLGSGAVTSGAIGSQAVDDTKVGERVPQLHRRQGGASNWYCSPGTTTWTPGRVLMQGGVHSITLYAGVKSAYGFVSFPQDYPIQGGTEYRPIVFVTLLNNSTNYADQPNVFIGDTYPGESEIFTWGFHYLVRRKTYTVEDTVDVSWLAIGPAAAGS